MSEHYMRHFDITAAMIRDANGGRSPYPISRIVGNEWLNPDGSITPMTETPEPTPTKAQLRAAVERVDIAMFEYGKVGHFSGPEWRELDSARKDVVALIDRLPIPEGEN